MPAPLCRSQSGGSRKLPPTLTTTESNAREKACKAAVLAFCGHGKVISLAPVPTLADHIATAQAFREALAKQCTRSLCAVCCIEKTNITQFTIGDDKSVTSEPLQDAPVRLNELPNAKFLLADIPLPHNGQHPPTAPRHALTTTTIAGKRYCLHPAGVTGHIVKGPGHNKKCIVNTCNSCTAAHQRTAARCPLPATSLLFQAQLHKICKPAYNQLHDPHHPARPHPHNPNTCNRTQTITSRAPQRRAEPTAQPISNQRLLCV